MDLPHFAAEARWTLVRLDRGPARHYYPQVVEQLFKENRLAAGNFVALGTRVDLRLRAPKFCWVRATTISRSAQLFAIGVGREGRLPGRKSDHAGQASGSLHGAGKPLRGLARDRALAASVTPTFVAGCSLLFDIGRLDDRPPFLVRPVKAPSACGDCYRADDRGRRR
jgi:hypothetical protein